MGEYKRLDLELTMLLYHHRTRKELEAHVFKFLLRGHGIPHPGPEDDVADLQELSLKIVSDYLKRHWWLYLKSRVRARILGIY